MSLFQVVYVTGIIGLLAARLPSFAEHTPAAFSPAGFLVGAAIALVGFGLGRLLSPAAATAEVKGTKLQLLALRGSVLSFFGALTAFTALIYFKHFWLQALIVGLAVLGGICIFAFNAGLAEGGERDG